MVLQLTQERGIEGYARRFGSLAMVLETSACNAAAPPEITMQSTSVLRGPTPDRAVLPLELPTRTLPLPRQKPLRVTPQIFHTSVGCMR